MPHPTAFIWTLAAAGLIVAGLSTPAARGEVYSHIGSGDYNDMMWTRGDPGDPDFDVNVGPPGPGDEAMIGGDTSMTLTCSGGSVDTLDIADNFDLSGGFTCTTFNDDGYLSGSGTVTAQTVGQSDSGTDIEGGNLVGMDCPSDLVVNGGSATVNNFTGINADASAGGSITIYSDVTDFNYYVASGGQLSVAGIANSFGQNTNIQDSGSQVTVTGDFTSLGAGGFQMAGGSLEVGGDLTLDGAQDIESGGEWNGASATVAGTFTVGETDPAGFSLLLDGGSVLTSQGNALVGESAGSNGLITMTDAGTVWQVAQGLAIGDAGKGDLEIQSGAHLAFGGGANSSFALGLAAGGSGLVDADGAGTLIDARDTIVSVATGTGSTGSVNLLDGASLLLGETLFVGDGGSGSLNINSGSQAILAGTSGAKPLHFAIGNQVSGSGNISVNGAGSQFMATPNVLSFIGLNGIGSLTEGDSATVKTEIIEMGAAKGAQGSVLVDGKGTTFTNLDQWFVGGSPSSQPGGLGTITVQNSGQLRTGLYGGAVLYLSPTGTVILDSTGQIAVGKGAFGPPGTLRVTAGGRVTGKGKVQGQVIVARGGIFEPGGDPGTFTIEGDFNQTDGGGGEMDLEVGGTKAGVDYDQLVVSGKARLGGTLKINLVNGYTPAVGDELGFIKAKSMSGAFTKVSSPGLTLKASSSGGEFALKVMEVTPGLPVQKSAVNASGTQGEAFSYRIVATNSPKTYTATGLPKGLSIDKTSGVISGKPAETGDFQVVLGFASDQAIGAGALDLDISGASSVPPPPAEPAVTVKATSPLAYEHDQLPGYFVLTRTGALTSPLIVEYTVKGSAAPGTDYKKLSGSVTIRADSATARIQVKPLDAGITGGAARTVQLTLKVGADYTLGSAATAKVKIIEND